MRIWKNEADHNPIHKKVNHDAVKNSRDDRVLSQKTNSAARQIKNRYNGKCDQEMNGEAEGGGAEAALKRSGADQTTGDSLQHADGTSSSDRCDYKRGGNVEYAHD